MNTLSTPTGLTRRELWVDARDLQSGEGEDALTPEEYEEVLKTRGKERLAEHQLVKSFSAAVRTQGAAFRFGEDYQLGDIITVMDKRLGVTAEAVVTQAAFSESRDGQELTLTLGYGQPSLYDKLMRKEDK